MLLCTGHALACSCRRTTHSTDPDNAEPSDANNQPPGGDKLAEEGSAGSQPAAEPAAAEGAEAAADASAAEHVPTSSAAASSQPQPVDADISAEIGDENTVQQVTVPTARLAYDPAIPAAATVEQHFIDTLAREHTVLKDKYLDGSDDVNGHADEESFDVPELSPLQSELEGAVNDQYGEFGITVEDLRTYLDVSLDIEDAISVGRKPDIQQDRYQVYKRVEKLVKFGPDKSPEELQRLDRMAELEMLNHPWPSTMVRNYVKQKHGVKMPRMKKDEQTQYDQVWNSILCCCDSQIVPCLLRIYLVMEAWCARQGHAALRLCITRMHSMCRAG
jgi:hypothetical protein